MIPERVAHECILLQLVEGLAQIAWQLIYPKMSPLAVTHGEDVLVNGRARIGLFLDAVEARAEHHGECQIGIARGIRHPQLDPCGDATCGWHADERTPVLFRPRDVRRRFVPWNETFVRIDER